MRVLNLGSLNIDKTYQVDHFVKPQETISARNYEEFCGGKGLNQSVALARAGANVHHAGAVGQDGGALIEALRAAGVSVELIQQMSGLPSGHAVIQIEPNGQNCILIYGGANQAIENAYIDAVLEQFGAGDLLLLQNETSCIAYAMEQAKQRGMKVALNPSPITAELSKLNLELVDYFLVNEVEGKALSGCSSESPASLIAGLTKTFPEAAIILTLGERGAYYLDANKRIFQKSYSVKAIDTTAAGDTFCGYLIASLAEGLSEEEAMRRAAAASAIAVSRKGASPSIPIKAEVIRFLTEREAF